MGEPFTDGVASVLVAPAVTADGQEVVLKVQDPHRESEHEAAALQLWDGDGAVRLLEVRDKLPSLKNRQADAYRWPAPA